MEYGPVITIDSRTKWIGILLATDYAISNVIGAGIGYADYVGYKYYTDADYKDQFISKLPEVPKMRASQDASDASDAQDSQVILSD